MKKRFVLFFILFGVHFLSSAQCAMCRAVLQSQDEGGIAKGINDGIVYLMALPYILIGGVFYFVYRKMRSTRS